jgi:hypothetical protein
MPKRLFQPGHAGRPTGTRNKLQADFLRDLAEAWARDGANALKVMIAEQPADFVKVVASLMPRELIFENVMSDLDEQQIDELILALRQRMIESRTAPALLASSDVDGVGDEPEPRH